MDLKLIKIKDRVVGSQPSKTKYTNRVVIFLDITSREWICNLDSRVEQTNFLENNMTIGACFAGFRKQSDTHVKLKSPISCIYNPQTKLL
jgi:hypothetical protein|tara:strand:- start:132 stop:401 length:270 start_codon:yes stop_codon:yes gene_type:complete